MPASTRNFSFRATTAPRMIVKANQDRSSLTVLNQHPTVDIYVCWGTSAGPLVATAGNHMGDRIGANGGQLFTNDDLDELWVIANAINDRIKVTEAVKSGRMIRR